MEEGERDNVLICNSSPIWAKKAEKGWDIWYFFYIYFNAQSSTCIIHSFWIGSSIDMNDFKMMIKCRDRLGGPRNRNIVS